MVLCNPTQLNNQVRIMVLRGLKPYSSSPINMAEILEDTANPIISFYAREQIRGKWSVLSDQIITLDLVNTTKSIMRRWNLKNFKQTFDGESYNTSQYGDLYICLYSDNVATEVTWNAEACLYFMDI